LWVGTRMALRPYELIGADVQCLKSSGVMHFVT
jgi:hypothetical protein